MKAKSKELYYVAGLASKWSGKHNSVGISTSLPEIEQRFIGIALSDFGIEPTKMTVEQGENSVIVYFFHSRVAKLLKKTADRRVMLAKNRELAARYLAGLFDANGVVTGTRVVIRGLDKKDELLLELVGIHSVNGSLLNISDFIMLIKPYSSLLSLSHLPGNERDPR